MGPEHLQLQHLWCHLWQQWLWRQPGRHASDDHHSRIRVITPNDQYQTICVTQSQHVGFWSRRLWLTKALTSLLPDRGRRCQIFCLMAASAIRPQFVFIESMPMHSPCIRSDLVSLKDVSSARHVLTDFGAALHARQRDSAVPRI